MHTSAYERGHVGQRAARIHQDDIGHIPLHQQALAWGMKKNVELVQLPDNYNWLKWVVVKAP